MEFVHRERIYYKDGSYTPGTNYKSRHNLIKAWTETGGHCWYCGTMLSPDKFVLEHQQPRKRGGTNTPDNVVAACHTCNNQKSNLTLEEFRNKKENIKFFGERHTFGMYANMECAE